MSNSMKLLGVDAMVDGLKTALDNFAKAHEGEFVALDSVDRTQLRTTYSHGSGASKVERTLSNKFSSIGVTKDGNGLSIRVFDDEIGSTNNLYFTTYDKDGNVIIPKRETAPAQRGRRQATSGDDS